MDEDGIAAEEGVVSVSVGGDEVVEDEGMEDEGVEGENELIVDKDGYEGMGVD